jgi:4-amino-4-deoxy-L-arabinose transferase-like glycosyltransferase
MADRPDLAAFRANERRARLKATVSSFPQRLLRILLHDRFPIACFAAALLIRLLWLAFVHPSPLSDFNWYFEQGQRLAAGQGYTVVDDGCPMWERGHPLASPRPTAFWPIGYPLFLSGLFRLGGGAIPPLLAAQLANLALYLGLMVTLAWCARRIFRSKLAGRIALLLLAFLPNHIAYVSLTSSEILFAFLSTLGVALLIRGREREGLWLRLAAGLVLGLATWTKPAAVLLPAMVLGVLHLRAPGRFVRGAAVVYFALALTLVPLGVRNWRAFGRFVLVSTNGGINLVIGNMPGAYAPGVFWNRELTALVRSETREAERDRRARAMAIEWLRRHPLATLVALPGKFVALYWADVDGFGWNRAADERLSKHPAWGPLRLGSELYYLALVTLALLSWRHRRRFDPALYGVGLAVFLHTTAVYLAFFGGSRFHFPLVPWIAGYAAATLAVGLEGALREKVAERGGPGAGPA